MAEMRYDVAVVGGGEAGIAAAVRAGELGAEVGLIEQSPQLGGACVATGTLPSKTFSISASMFDLAQRMKNFGVRIDGPVSLDFPEVVASRLKVTRCDQGVIQTHLRSQGVRVIKGRAVFRSGQLIEADTADGPTDISADRFIVATGSKPIVLPGLETDGTTVLSTDDIISLSARPGHILILGAGVIGCEYAFIFRTFGSEVTLIEKLDHALLGQDRDIVALVERELKKKGVRFKPGTTLTRCVKNEEGRALVMTDKGEMVVADKALICVGRRPATDGLNLLAAQVGVGKRGEILVDGRLETTSPGIYAAGDVLGRRMLSATAILEGTVAAENAMGEHRELDERFVPSGIYTQPEIGSVGLTEDEAVARGLPVLVGKCNFAGLVKACALFTYTPGIIKMLFDPYSHRLLGGHILGTDAAEIVHHLVTALALGARAEDFIYAVYHHPSLSEGLREAARDALAKHPA
jgi:dihydrolipoamide dehydrogenase